LLLQAKEENAVKVARRPLSGASLVVSGYFFLALTAGLAGARI
jgi:hypothetical protein